MKQQQLPGRQEALRIVLADREAPEPMRRLAGLHRTHGPRPPAPYFGTLQFTSGIELLTQAERAALPF